MADPRNHDGRAPPGDHNIVALAEAGQHEILTITELESWDGTFIGKCINPDGSITGYPKFLKLWRQSVARVPATIPHLFAYLREARERNICLIRGAPANPARQPTRKIKVGVSGTDDHGFYDEPTILFPLDLDGVKINWCADPDQAIKDVVLQLGEPWASTSFVWFFTTQHGLELETNTHPLTGKKYKRWTGRITDGILRARLLFLAERSLNQDEATALTNIAKAHVPQLDIALCRTVQANYIRRPLWIEHPDRDVLGDIATIGWVKGIHDTLAIPDNLAHIAHWAKAQGLSSSIADHPDAESAVHSIVHNINNGGEVYPHMGAAIQHLLIANPIPKTTSLDDHSNAIVSKLQKMIERRHTEVYGSSRQLQGKHLPDAVRWANWLLERPGALKRKTIKLLQIDWNKSLV